MDFSQLVGFIVTVAGFIYFMIQHIKMNRREHEDEFSEEPQDRLNNFLKSLEDDMREKKVEQPMKKVVPPPIIKAQKPPLKTQSVVKKTKSSEFKSSLDDHSFLSTSKGVKDAPSYEVIKEHDPSQVQELLHQLPSKKQMVIYQEVMGLPLALRK
jgi:hypothetical protein